MAEKNGRSLFARIRYEFDKTMAAGPIALIGWLGIASFAVIGAAAALLHTSRIAPQGGAPLGFVEAFWEATMRTIDAGNVGGDNGWAFRAVMLVVTLWGIFVVSSLIGLLGAGVQVRIEELRKGRSRVLERGHTVVLNWSDAIGDVAAELLLAHEDDKRFRVVVLADKDKIEMEDALAAKIGRHRLHKIVCRSGDPGALEDLKLVNLDQARSIIVLADGGEADALTLKIVLAIVHGPGRRAEPFRIAAEFRDAKNAHIAEVVGGREVQAVMADDLISKIIVHSSRQAGLSAVYLELLDFAGCEFYTLAHAALAGKTFGQAANLFRRGALVGLCDKSGRVRLNPDWGAAIEAGQMGVFIASDRKGVTASNKPAPIDEKKIVAKSRGEHKSERVLILGWNRRGPEIVRQLPAYFSGGSQIVVGADREALAARPCAGADMRAIDTTDRTAIESLEPASFNHVVVLSEADRLPMQTADTRSLVALLHLRHIAENAGAHFTVISEIADVRNRALAQVTRADDFVVSHRLVSLMLAQASENEFIGKIFGELLDAAGPEIYMRRASDYVAPGEPVDFYTLVEAAGRRAETAFGYARGGKDGLAVTINPDKAEPVTFGADDFLIVLADN
jgi:voltage-gated potassium channel Kch